MIICDECVHQWECWDQRGLCNQFKSKEELRREIEKLNEDYKKTAGRSGADKGGIQEAGRGNLRPGNAGDRDPERLSSEACADAGTSAKAEGKREEAEGTTAEKAEEERGILDTGKRGKADPDV